ncbi:hypothetical protein BpHYR1_041911 [Brachionus plicatilis]|uniref:Uncharacterized protein n=1 Tax=Brachionus plicatilis TaxID=10195 RepID=A0A3M7S1X2_BRAPC|nr:hypothetical protein BpHYR1_041911 [Brachionus plicatilis]
MDKMLSYNFWLLMVKIYYYIYVKLVTITIGTLSKFGFIPYGTNTIETIINLDIRKKFKNVTIKNFL